MKQRRDRKAPDKCFIDSCMINFCTTYTIIQLPLPPLYTYIHSRIIHIYIYKETNYSYAYKSHAFFAILSNKQKVHDLYIISKFFFKKMQFRIKLIYDIHVNIHICL